jgi:hypothetical protein
MINKLVITPVFLFILFLIGYFFEKSIFALFPLALAAYYIISFPFMMMVSRMIGNRNEIVNLILVSFAEFLFIFIFGAVGSITTIVVTADSYKPKGQLDYILVGGISLGCAACVGLSYFLALVLNVNKSSDNFNKKGR